MPTNPRRSNGHRRTQLRNQVLAEETHCAICGGPVDVTLRHGLPESPEVDEIIPVSRGGNPLVRENVRLSHRICNQRRGNKMQVPLPAPGTITTSRPW